MCSVDLNMGTLSGITRIKMIFSFSQALTRISLLTHSAALTILLHSAFISCTFHSKQCLLQNPRRKNWEKSNLENKGGKGPQMTNTLYMHLNALDQAEKTEKSYHTKWTTAQLILPFISEISCLILLSLKAVSYLWGKCNDSHICVPLIQNRRRENNSTLQSVLFNVRHFLMTPKNMFLYTCLTICDVWAVWALNVRLLATFWSDVSL
jgi:hypothetical protein